jgi:hypothetical protein
MRFTLSIFIALYSYVLFSQFPDKIGTTWEYYVHTDINSYFSFIDSIYGDTLINNKLYKNIIRKEEDSYNPGNYFYEKYCIRVESDSVFIISEPDVSTNEYILFDFSIPHQYSNKTFFEHIWTQLNGMYFGAGKGTNSQYTLTNTGTQTYNGLEIYDFEPDSSIFRYHWAKNIGVLNCIDNVFYPYSVWKLYRCKDIDSVYYVNTIVGIEDNEIKRTSEEYIPNIIDNSVNIKFDWDRLSIYDISGKLLKNKVKNDNPDSPINVSYLNPGIYILVIENNNSQKSYKIYKQ